MKRKRKLIFTILMTAIIIIGITIYAINKQENVPLEFVDDILLIYETRPVEGFIYEMYDKNITIYNDGKVEITGTFEYGEIITVTTNIKGTDIVDLQNIITNVNFMELEEDISTDSLDGAYENITVKTKTGSHTSGGLNPNNKRFCEVEDKINEVIEQKDFDVFNQKIWDYIEEQRELNNY